MAFFEDELKKIFGNSPVISDARFVGRSCIGRLGDTTNIKLEFVTLGTRDKYEGIKATVFNRNEGVIDVNVFRFSDILGMKPSKNNPSNIVDPRIWVYNNMPEWYAFKPSAADYSIIAAPVNSYLEVFLDPTDISRNIEKSAAKSSGEYTSVMGAIRQDKEKGSNAHNTQANVTSGRVTSNKKFYAATYNPRGSLSPDASAEYEIQSFSDKKSRDDFVNKNQNPEGYLGKSHAVSLKANDVMVKEWEIRYSKRSGRDAR